MTIRAIAALIVLSCAGFAQTSITISIAPAAVSWPSLSPGSAANAGSAPVTLTTTWSLSPAGGGDNLKIFAFFTSSTAALAHSPACSVACGDIPSSAFEIGVSGGALTKVTATTTFGAAGASLQLVSIPITGANKNGTRVDNLQLNINLSTLPNLPADTYSGVLNIQAQSIP